MEQKDGKGGAGPFKPGDRFGDCTVERLLGKGGLGFVYLVRGPDGERYALKALRTDASATSPEYKQRFAQEANLMMTMLHRNLVRVYDAGEDAERGICYIMMEYMPGGTLMGMLAKAVKGDPLPDVRTMRPEVSASVAYVLSLMCAPKPENRPVTSRAAADLLVRASVDGLILPQKPQQPQSAGRNERKGGWLASFFRRLADVLGG